MIQGFVNSIGNPNVTLEIAGQNWNAMIDTGFNGDLELPSRLRKSFKARYVGRMHSLLAGGQIIAEKLYVIDFPFDDAVVRAETTFVAGDEILIGTNLIRKHRLEIDFVQKTVLLEKSKYE